MLSIQHIRFVVANLAFALLCAAASAAHCLAQDTPDKSAESPESKPPQVAIKDAGDADRPTLATISETQEKSILAFVSTHDEPLHGLLGNLRKSRPLEYQKALADLYRVTERLAQVKKNRPHAYDLEVKRWQAQSKVQMLSARLATKPDPEIRANLKQAIKERIDLELQVLRADRLAAEKRLKQLDEQIEQAESSMQNRVQVQFDRTVAASRRARLGKNSEALKKRPVSDSEDKDAPRSDSPANSSKREGANP